MIDSRVVADRTVRGRMYGDDESFDDTDEINEEMLYRKVSPCP